MLAEKARMSGGQAYEVMVSSYEDDLEEWSDYLHSRKDDLDRWDYRRRFWEILSDQGARVSWQTWRFIVTWLQMALSSERARKIAGDEYARRLIHERERLLKRNLSRLDNPEALARWSGDAGTGRLRYRWRPAEKIISDILLGLRRS
jgi:hypothetical protein